MSEEKKRYINYVPLGEKLHQDVIEQATLVGMLPSDFAALLIEERLAEKWTEPTQEGEPERYVAWQLMKMRRHEKMVGQAYAAAAIYRKYRTEENADRLELICDTAGLALNEVIEKIDDDPFWSIHLQAKNGSVLGDCMRWLSAFIAERGGSVSARIVKVVATRNNFSDSTLERAKRTINSDPDSPTIGSERRGKGWVWYIVDDSQKEEETAPKLVA